MKSPLSCAVVCPDPPPHPLPAALDPISDGFSFSEAKEAARQRAEAALQAAADAADTSDLIVLPEDIQGIRHFWRTLETPKVFKKLAEPLQGPITRAARGIARSSRKHLTLTFYETDKGRIYNTTMLVGPNGKPLAKYHKVHLAPGEDWLVLPGEGFFVVPTPLGRLALVCGEDYLFPETPCVLGRLNAEIVVCPSKCPLPEAVLSTRSFEHGFATVFAQPASSYLIDQQGTTLFQSAGRAGFVLTGAFVELPPARGDREDLEIILTGITDRRRRLATLRRPHAYRELAQSPSSPDIWDKWITQRRKNKWKAYEELHHEWENGPSRLPEWEL